MIPSSSSGGDDVNKKNATQVETSPSNETTLNEIVQSLNVDKIDLTPYKFNQSNGGNIITSRLEFGCEIEEVLVQPNVDGANIDVIIEKICQIVNENGVAVVKSFLGNKVVDQGNIRVVEHNGCIEVAGPGRYLKPNPRAHWKSNYSLESDIITHETLKIIRIRKGFYGTASLNGKPLILNEGLHVRNTRLFNFVGTTAVNTEIIKHGTINIIRIPQGHYGKVIENNVPKLVTPGNYVIDSVLFTYSGLVAMNVPLIEHGTIKIIRVEKGNVGLIRIGTKPCLLQEGLYTFNDQNVTFTGIKPATDNLISHAPITRFRVNLGEIGLAWWNQKPIFIQEPNVYEVDSIFFSFEKCVPVKTKLIILGSSMRIVVFDGEVGVTYKSGKLDVLLPGTYVFHDQLDRTFESYMSTKLMSIPLLEDHSKEPFLRCDTRDFVEVGIRAAVSFRVSDPRMTLTVIGNETQTVKLIKDNSIAALQSIVRSTALNQLAQSKTISASELVTDKSTLAQHLHGEEAPASAPQFFENLHDEFLTKLHDTFKKQYGIEIDNIRIEDFQIMNQELATNISKQAIITAETSTKLANLEAQREIDLAGQERLNSINSIKATAEAFKLKTETEARNNATIIEAETKAIEIKTLAKAKAEALTIEAEAQAKAIEIKALAEKKRAEYLSSTEFGKQEALLTKHHDMVIEAMKSVSQVVYLPSDANMGCLPIQMFGLKGGVPTFDSITQQQPTKK